MIMMGSVAHPKKTIISRYRKHIDENGISKLPRSSGRILTINKQFWADFDKHDLIHSIQKITCPIFFIHGSEDPIVPLSDMEEYFRVANSPKEKLIIQGADHGLRPHRDIMYKAVTDWFKKYLTKI